MSLTENDITAKNFKKFFTALSPYLGSYDKGKLTFVGEVKAFFAETAPNGFLVCDGATYNKADYPQLANLLLSLTDHSAYEVSGDDTKFKVPDLRGEFLRGSGTNSHTNQGSGAGVGEHQDGTEHYQMILGDNHSNLYYTVKDANNIDSTNTSIQARKKISAGTNETGGLVFTSRPTNTSVLFCIAYKDTMVDLDFLSYGGEKFAKSDMYDTNERVIGKWIDGKPLYKKTVNFGALPNNNSKAVAHGISNLGVVVDYYGTAYSSSWGTALPRTNKGSLANNWEIQYNTTNVTITTGDDRTDFSAYVHLIYTKTTDSADSFKYSTPTDYSTEEKIVGTWIDGKPIYQKTVDCGKMPNNTTKLIPHNITNFDMLVKGFGVFRRTDENKYKVIPMLNQGSTSNQIDMTIGSTNIELNTGMNWENISANGYVTLQYTKTTDA